ncbi:right-handed parallel beta-helix repeat-containing protein [Corallococcus interemptor]|uniref:right-handed parallel beta-helix repeat-containing protein n=1 Tax=Corallococcus interemptor TaxID=2316720 RepID=UPI003D015FD4
MIRRAVISALSSVAVLLASPSQAALDRDIIAGSQEFTLPHASYVPTPGNIRYVDSTYTGTSDGTEAKPWRTLQAAINALQPGQAAYVRGLFTENLVWTSAVNGTSALPITLMAWPGYRPTLKNTGTTPLLDVTKSYWIIDGFDLDGNRVFSSVARFKGANAHNVSLRNSKIVNARGGSAIFIGDFAHHIQVHHTTVQGTLHWSSLRANTSCSGHASCAAQETTPAVGLVCVDGSHCATREDGHAVSIYPDSHHVLLTDNTFSDNSGDGVQCVGPAHAEPAGTGTVRPHDILMIDNTIANTSNSDGNTENAIDIKDCDDVTIRGGHISHFRATRNETGNASKGEAIVAHFDAQRILIEGVDISDACRGITLGRYATNEQLANVVIRRNIIRDPALQSRETNRCPSNAIWMTRVAGVDVYHNTFDGWENATVSVGEEMAGVNVTNVDLWNNIFKSGMGYYIGANQGGVSGLESGYNLFTQGAEKMLRCNFTYVDIAGWRACPGIPGLDPESNSRWGDPLFSGLSRETQPGSPARDMALNDTQSTTYCGSGPDVGARESCATTPQQPSGVAPSPLWGLQRGTTGDDMFQAVTTNSQNDILYAGITDGDFNYTPQGGTDAIIGRYSSSGSLGWSRLLGGPGDERALAITTDAANNVYAVGETSSNLGGTHAGNGDAFIVKYDATGTKQWVVQPATTAADGFHGVASDGSAIYAGGFTDGSFPGQPHHPSTGGDFLLMKLNAAGAIVWTRVWGTDEMNESVQAVAYGAGGIYVLGHSYYRHIYIAKFTTDGTKVWERTYPQSMAVAFGLTVDATGNAYVAGYFQPSSEYFTPMVIKLDSEGTEQWVKTDFDWPPASLFGIRTDSAGNIIVAGMKGLDMAVWKLTPTGTLIWKGGYPSSAVTYGLGIAVDSADDIVLVGETRGDVFSTNLGYRDAFILKYPN